VEQNYIGKWREYHQAIQQRNALLRNNANPSLFYAWHKVLSVLGLELHQSRITCINSFSRILNTLPINRFFGDVSITYNCGWHEERPLLEELNLAIHADKATGTTSVGPHRAEAAICVDGILAHKVLSRGQAKLAASSLVITQARVIFEHTSVRPLFLFDDFGSELDSPSRLLLWDMISKTCGQIFLTSIDLDSLPVKDLEKAHFHIVNGAVERLR
jgi:DNA replication and repair protein RecF